MIKITKEDNMALNKIYCESNLETMSRMPDNFVDLTVTSPPYDNLRDYKGYSFPFEEIAKELYRVTKEGGVVVWIVGDATVKGSETGSSFEQALHLKNCGFNLHDTMIYEKANPMPMRAKRYQSCFEYMFVFSKGKVKTFNPITVDCEQAGRTNIHTFRKPDGSLSKKTKTYNSNKTIKNIWSYNVGFGSTTKDKIAFEHPAIFPEQLAKDHILSWSNEGDIVYDPFNGSGTTSKMALVNKRKYIGSEISPEYVAIAEKRLKPYLDQLEMF